MSPLLTPYTSPTVNSDLPMQCRKAVIHLYVNVHPVGNEMQFSNTFRNLRYTRTDLNRANFNNAVALGSL
jgi:hypothetical protein